jgi:hypothetical protein
MGMDHQRFFAFFNDVELRKSVADALHALRQNRARHGKTDPRAIRAHPVELTGSIATSPPATIDRANPAVRAPDDFSPRRRGEDSRRHYAEVLRSIRNARTLAAVGRFDAAITAG